MRRALLVASTLVLGLAAPATAADLELDLRRPLPSQPSLTGFVETGLRSGDPRDHFCSPLATALRPGLWRGGWTDSPARCGARPVHVLSDRWGYPSDPPPPRGFDRPPPYAAPARWEAHARDQARRAAPDAVFDVWNEPDKKAAWWGSREDLFETYALAERAIRRERGAAGTVAGPSLARFDFEYLRGLLEFCLRRGCEVNVLSWHEVGGPAEVAQHVRAVRRRLVANQRYAPLRVREIHVNEYGGPGERARPGTILGYVYALERGGADAAAKACWPDAEGVDGCDQATLSNLLTLEREPTSAWWASWAYATTLHRRVAVRVRRGGLAAFGARGPNRTGADLLLGRFARMRGAVSVTIRGLGRARRVRVRPFSMPDLGDAALRAPRRRRAVVVRVRRGAARFRLAAPKRGEAVLLRIRRGG
jgi:hypothetical protein